LGSPVVRRYALRHLRPALRVDALAGVEQVDEHARHRDVADRELLAHEIRSVAELSLQVVEARRKLLVDDLLDRRLVGLLAHELLLDDARKEDLGSEDLDQRGVGVLLEPERPRELVSVLGVQRGLRVPALEVLADHRGVREGVVAVAERGNFPERAHLPKLGIGIARHHRIVVVGNALLREDRADLANEGGEADAVECRHAAALRAAANRVNHGAFVDIVSAASLSSASMPVRGRCILLGGVVAVVLMGASLASAVVPTPDVNGPITSPGSASIAPPSGIALAAFGYVEREFFVSGTASSFTSAAPLTADGEWTAAPGDTAHYVTRILVRRPTDARKFNGTVVVEWLNVSGGLDAAPDWTFTHPMLKREGFAWVGVSAQLAGVSGTGGPIGL